MSQRAGGSARHFVSICFCLYLEAWDSFWRLWRLILEALGTILETLGLTLDALGLTLDAFGFIWVTLGLTGGILGSIWFPKRDQKETQRDL